MPSRQSTGSSAQASPKKRALLEKLEASMHAAAGQGRSRTDLTGFALFIDEHSVHPIMSFAVPQGPEPANWDAAVSALIESFETRARRPRLEFFEELYPALAAALEWRGFRREMRAPVMTLAARSWRAPGALPAGHYRRLRADDAGLEPFLRGQHLAYGGVGDALAWLPGLKGGLARGTILAAALEQYGEPVSGASVIMGGALRGAVAELAGVWTRPDKQRRGLAYALCARLLDDFFAAGGELCWLSAAEGALALYVKLGFEEVGTQSNYAF